MNINHTDDGRKGAFYIGEADHVQAEMTYLWSGSKKILIDHTAVKPELQGQGIGRRLFEQAVAFAREKNIKILPLCPFAQSQFDINPDYADVLF